MSSGLLQRASQQFAKGIVAQQSDCAKAMEVQYADDVYRQGSDEADLVGHEYVM